MSGKQTQWLDYVPSPILALTITSTFCAAALQDGSLNIYSHNGRRLVMERCWICRVADTGFEKDNASIEHRIPVLCLV